MNGMLEISGLCVAIAGAQVPNTVTLDAPEAVFAGLSGRHGGARRR